MIATLVGGSWAQEYYSNNKTRKFQQNQGVFNISEITTVDSLLNRRPKIRHPKPGKLSLIRDRLVGNFGTLKHVLLLNFHNFDFFSRKHIRHT